MLDEWPLASKPGTPRPSYPIPSWKTVKCRIQWQSSYRILPGSRWPPNPGITISISSANSPSLQQDSNTIVWTGITTECLRFTSKMIRGGSNKWWSAINQYPSNGAGGGRNRVEISTVRVSPWLPQFLIHRLLKVWAVNLELKPYLFHCKHRLCSVPFSHLIKTINQWSHIFFY